MRRTGARREGARRRRRRAGGRSSSCCRPRPTAGLDPRLIRRARGRRPALRGPAGEPRRRTAARRDQRPVEGRCRRAHPAHAGARACAWHAARLFGHHARSPIGTGGDRPARAGVERARPARRAQGRRAAFVDRPARAGRVRAAPIRERSDLLRAWRAQRL